MNIPWTNLLFKAQSSDEKLNIFTEIIRYGLDTIMPERSIKVHETDKPWMNANLKQLIKRRQKAFSSGDVFLYKLLRNKVNRERKRCRMIYYKNKVQDLQHTKPRDWWREVKQFCGTSKAARRDIRSILRTNTESSDQDLANEIMKASVSVMDNYTPLSEDVCVLTDHDEPIVVDEESIAKKLRQINISRAGGPDGIPNWVLKTFSDILSPAITNIINASFRESKVPRVWKLANVTPLPKTVAIEDFNKDLRPISLTPTLSKIAESCIIEQEIRPTLLKAMDPNQFGFVPNSCTTFALISMLHRWLENTDGTGSRVRVALLDYRKAFDLVDHNILIAKLFSLGVKPTVVNWIADFLRGRSQRLKLNSDCFSNSEIVPAGIPQGTKIGPWLFLAMINDLAIPGNSSDLWKFADDTTVSEIIPKTGSSRLQVQVDQINCWSNENNFQLNSLKCKELRIDFTRHRHIDDPITVNDLAFEVVQSVKILGVTIREDLKWNDHVTEITHKASKRLYLLRILKRAGVDVNSLVQFYCTCIRSTLEYACQTFHSNLPEYLSNQIERIQKRALRMLYPEERYGDALKLTGLQSLADRRDRLCRELFNSVSINNNHKLADLLPPLNSNNINLRSTSKYDLPVLKTNRFKDSFINYYASKVQR
jgi:hypothetical protein